MSERGQIVPHGMNQLGVEQTRRRMSQGAKLHMSKKAIIHQFVYYAGQQLVLPLSSEYTSGDSSLMMSKRQRSVSASSLAADDPLRSVDFDSGLDDENSSLATSKVQFVTLFLIRVPIHS